MVELLDYNPYGTERISWSSSSVDGEAAAQKTYIGEYSDDETNLSYLNARYYDPQRGQFLSQDSVYVSFVSGSLIDIVLLRDPQSQNGYLYARGNPISFVDPEGEFWGEVVSFFAGVTNAVISNNAFGLGRVDSSDGYYNSGQVVGDSLAVVQGAAEIVAGVTVGAGGTATGVAVTAGSVGVLAPAGAGVSVGAAVAGAAIATHGIGTAGSGVFNLMNSRGSSSGAAFNRADLSNASGKTINGNVTIPKGWTVKSSPNGVTRYSDPNNGNNSIRLSPGNPNSPYPNSQGPYMRIHQFGKGYVDANGNSVSRTASEGHIPITSID